MKDHGFEYLAFGPEDEVPQKIVLLLHGYGRNAHYMVKMADEIRGHVPDALVLCPHGPEDLNTKNISVAGDHMLHIPEEIQDAKEENDSEMRRQWFPIEGGLFDLIPRLQGISIRLNSFLDRQRDMLGLADKDIAIMGFSQGAGTALYTAYAREKEIAALVCHSAIVIKDAEQSDFKSTPRTLFLYGDKDPEFAQDIYQRSYDWVSGYTKGGSRCEVISGLGHTTNAETRKLSAAFIAGVFRS